MDPLTLGAAAITAGATLFGGKMTSDANASQNKLAAIYNMTNQGLDRQMQQANNDYLKDIHREQFNYDDYKFNETIRQANIDRDLQREYARNGIQWRVADARAAGIHPLAALGAQTSSPSAIQVGGGSSPSAPSLGSYSSPTVSPGTPSGMGAAIASAGQDIGRAIAATSGESSRAAQVAEAQQGLQLQNLKLQNELLASQIAKTTGASVGPAMPTATQRKMIDGQGNTPTKGGRIKNELVEEKKHEPVVGHPKQPQSEPGNVTDVGYARTKDGYTPVPSKDVKERIEDSFLSEVLWEIRNRVPQTFGFKLSPPAHVPMNKGERWWYNPLAQEYQKHSYTPPGKTNAVRSRNYMRTN